MDSKINEIVKHLTEQDINRVALFIESIREKRNGNDENYRKFKMTAMTDIRAALKSNYFSF